MAQKFFYSQDNRALYPVALKSRYDDAGSWPKNGFLVDDGIALQFQADPARGENVETGYKGKEIVKKADGSFEIVEV